MLDNGVDNFGVGNYGFDQALLRLERELPSLECRVVIMGVVPETISRVQSYWKHYFEYGNTLAFKPRFILEGDRLVHHPLTVWKPEDFETYAASAGTTTMGHSSRGWKRCCLSST